MGEGLSGSAFLKLSCVAVIVALDALCERFKERRLLGVTYDFRQAVVDRPTATADTTIEQILIKTFGMQISFLVVSVLTDWALHKLLLHMVGYDRYCVYTINTAYAVR